MSTLDTLLAQRLVPVVVIDDAAAAAPLAESLVDGGLPVAEVTFRTAAAPEALREMSRHEDLLVGAGTVLCVDQARMAVDCGARFIVSPGYSSELVAFGREGGVPVLPGVATATDVMRALADGVELVKFFPAEAMGGVATVKALSAPFPQVRFVPTGGVAERNLADYLAVPSVAAVGGSWMVPKKLMATHDWPAVTDLVRSAVAAVARAR